MLISHNSSVMERIDELSSDGDTMSALQVISVVSGVLDITTSTFNRTGGSSMPSIEEQQQVQQVRVEVGSLYELVYHPPYKHSTSGPPAGLQRTATTWRPANPHPLDGTEVACKVGLQGVAGAWPPLSLPFYPLGLPLCCLLFHFSGLGLQQLT